MAMQVGELFATLTLDDSAFYRATASAQSALAALSRSLGALSGQGRSAGLNFARGLAGGIASGTPAIRSAARRAAQAARRAAEAELQIHSPSRVGIKIGGYFSEGVAGGIGQGVRMVSGAANALARSAQRGMTRREAANERVPAAQTIDYDRLAQAMAEHQTVLVSNGKVLARSTAADNSQALGAYKRKVAKGYGG